MHSKVRKENNATYCPFGDKVRTLQSCGTADIQGNVELNYFEEIEHRKKNFKSDLLNCHPNAFLTVGLSICAHSHPCKTDGVTISSPLTHPDAVGWQRKVDRRSEFFKKQTMGDKEGRKGL